jgi:hypothetical protein
MNNLLVGSPDAVGASDLAQRTGLTKRSTNRITRAGNRRTLKETVARSSWQVVGGRKVVAPVLSRALAPHGLDTPQHLGDSDTGLKPPDSTEFEVVSTLSR